jgi:hypothetical protein
MVVAPRSGSFPVTFVATDQSDIRTYSAIAAILIFAEGLDEFAAWQLIGLVLIALAILYYSDFSATKKISHNTRNKTHRSK